MGARKKAEQVRKKPNLHVKKGDTVKVIAGKDKGAQGKVITVLREEQRVVVEGVNRVKRHTKPTKANQQGGIMDKEMPIDISNVQLVCPSCGRPTRIGHRVEDGKKIRICRKCKADV